MGPGNDEGVRRKAAECRAGLESIEVRRDGVMDGWKRPLGADSLHGCHLKGLRWSREQGGAAMQRDRAAGGDGRERQVAGEVGVQPRTCVTTQVCLHSPAGEASTHPSSQDCPKRKDRRAATCREGQR